MYSKEEKRLLNQEFWTAFGSYMKPRESAFSKKVNWSNYKTGVSQIYVRFIVTHKQYEFKIEIQDKDDMIKSLFFEQFEELKSVLSIEFEDDLEWNQTHINQFNEETSKIFISTNRFNYHDKSQWSELFELMKAHITSFDQFWYDWKDTFVELAR